MGSVDEYDINDQKTPIQKSEQWRNLSPEDKRRMAVDFYYATLGLCEKKSIKHCAPSDTKFIAKVTLLLNIFTALMSSNICIIL